MGCGFLKLFIYLFILFVQVNIYWWPPSLGAHLVADQNLILMEKKICEHC